MLLTVCVGVTTIAYSQNSVSEILKVPAFNTKIIFSEPEKMCLKSQDGNIDSITITTTIACSYKLKDRPVLILKTVVEDCGTMYSPFGLGYVDYTRNNEFITLPSTGEPDWQYSKDNGKTWQKSNVFSDLEVDEFYLFIVKDNNDNLSTMGIVNLNEPAVVRLEKQTVADNNRSIIISPPTGGSGTGWQYSIDRGRHWQSSNVFESIDSMDYAILVKDDNDFFSDVVTGVFKIPDISIDIQRTDPACRNSNDGSIKVAARGGVSPYHYRWEEEGCLPEQFRSNLSEGIYNLRVIDAYGYDFGTVIINLVDPEIVKIELGEDIVLCKNTTAELNATVPRHLKATSYTDVLPKKFTVNVSYDTFPKVNVKYQWYKDEEPFAQTAGIKVAKQGIYKVEAQSEEGCIIGRGEINISESDYEMVADFAVSTKTADKTVTRLVNISYPEPDKIEWIIPENNTSVISSTNEYADLIFNKNERYRVGLRAWKGDCSTTVYKEIEITDANAINIITTENATKNEQASLLKKFIAYPNPNTGQFTVHVELGIKTDIRLRLISLTGILIEERALKGSDIYDTYYDTGGLEGIYIIQLIAENINDALKLIIGTN
jgi:hypothetical protein